jgi:hypothetical protein
MKSKAKEPDVDFIGGQGPLTKAEEQAISEYIKRQKALKAKKKSKSTSVRRRKIVA